MLFCGNIATQFARNTTTYIEEQEQQYSMYYDLCTDDQKYIVTHEQRQMHMIYI